MSTEDKEVPLPPPFQKEPDWTEEEEEAFRDLTKKEQK